MVKVGHAGIANPYNQFCHPVQRYAATQCNVMLPPSVQNIIHAEGVPRLRFDRDDVRFVLMRVR
jgi:hypothetical protein